MEDNEIIALLAAILLAREGGEMTLDEMAAGLKDPPDFEFERNEDTGFVTIKLNTLNP